MLGTYGNKLKEASKNANLFYNNNQADNAGNETEDAMRRSVIVNFSGGKDSTVAILETLKRYPKEEIILSWQDTGAEYLETEAHVKKIAGLFDLPLVIIKAKRDFWQELQHRKHWPTPVVRHCTAHLKRDPANSWIKQHKVELGNELIIVTGIRAEESKSRALKHEWEDYPDLTLKDGSRIAHTWYPCLNMTKQEIYDRIEAEGLPLHPCYEFCSRLSCWMCIFAHPNEVRAYAEKQPALYEAACEVEEQIKHKWKEHFALQDLFLQGKLF